MCLWGYCPGNKPMYLKGANLNLLFWQCRNHISCQTDAWPSLGTLGIILQNSEKCITHHVKEFIRGRHSGSVYASLLFLELLLLLLSLQKKIHKLLFSLHVQVIDVSSFSKRLWKFLLPNNIGCIWCFLIAETLVKLASLASCTKTFWTQSEALIDFQPRKEDSSLPIMGFKQRRKWVEERTSSIAGIHSAACQPLSSLSWQVMFSVFQTPWQNALSFRVSRPDSGEEERGSRNNVAGLRNTKWGKRERWKRGWKWGQGMRQVEKIHLSSGIWIIFFTISLPPIPPPKKNPTMHNVFSSWLAKVPVKICARCKEMDERKRLSDVDGSLNMSRRYSTHTHTRTHTYIWTSPNAADQDQSCIYGSSDGHHDNMTHGEDFSPSTLATYTHIHTNPHNLSHMHAHTQTIWHWGQDNIFVSAITCVFPCKVCWVGGGSLALVTLSVSFSRC